MNSHAAIIAEAAHHLRKSRDWTQNAQGILDRLGEAMGVSRVYLFQVHDIPGRGLGQSCLFDWATPGLHRLVTDARNIAEIILDSDAAMMDWASRRRRGEVIKGDTRDLRGYLREDFEHQEIKSFISAPLMVNGQWWGHIGFDDCVNERAWSDSETAVLQTIAYLLGDSIELSTSSLVMSEATRIAMLQTAPDGIVVVDESGAILDFNPAAEKIFGAKRSRMIGRQASQLLIPQRLRRQFSYLLKSLRSGGARRLLGQHTEAVGLHSSGADTPLELAITEIRQGGRRLFVAYLRDLTERKRAEASIARQREALHQSEKMTALGSLLAGVAHELNNPLSVVIGRAVMLEEDITDPVHRERLKKLREAAERCAKVSKTFLAMARQHPPERAPMQVNKAIATALDLVAYTLRSSGTTVELHLDDALPAIIGDQDQLIQVFVNLMVNAEHAMREQDSPRALAVSSASDPGHVVITIRDTGPGIDPDVLPRIFEPFFTTKEVGAGTGLGLAVSFGMVAAHGGLLEAIAQPPGDGACFRVTLPVNIAAAVVPPPVPVKVPKTLSRNVLVIDDEPEVAGLLRDIFQRAGHRTSHAGNGQAALDLAAQESFDAIFCDLRMPVMDGRGFRRRLLNRQPIYQNRMAFVTGDLLSSESGGDELDGCPLIEKPFASGIILETLNRMTETP